jgi:hypothetical protein
MKNFKYLLIIAILFSIGTAESCKKPIKQSDPANPLNSFHVALPPLPLANQYTTTLGAFVDTQDAIPPEMQASILSRIDQGLEKLLATTTNKNYVAYRRVSDFNVLMIRANTVSDVSGCDLLVTKSGQTIAGTVLSLGSLTILPPFILIPENFNENENCQIQTQNATRFEGEHIEAWFNDRDFFWNHTGTLDVHPGYADENGNFRGEEIVGKEFQNDGVFGDKNTPPITVNVDNLITLRRNKK